MPQIEQIDTYLSQVFWLVVAFGVLYLVMTKVLIPRMVSILEARVFQIESDMRRADEAKFEAEEFGGRIEYMLVQARVEAEEACAAAVAREREKTEQRLREFEEEFTAKIRESEARFADSYRQALRGAERDIVGLVEGILLKFDLPLSEGVSSEDLRETVREQIGRAEDRVSSDRSLGLGR